MAGVETMIVDHTDVGAAFRRLSIPSAVAMLGDQLLGVVDTIVIGSLGTVALAGATAANAVAIASAFAAMGFTTGTSIVAAQRIGAGDVDGFARTVRGGAAGPVLWGIVAFAASLAGSAALMHAMLGNIASAGDAAAYLTYRCAALVPIALSGTLIAGLGAAGNRKLGIYVLIAINLVHIPLVLALCLGWWTHHPFGIAGAGLSSLLAETTGAIFALAYAVRRPVYRIFARWTLDWRLAWECIRLGFPEAVFLLGVMLPDAFIVAMLAPLGPAIVAGFRALNVVSDLTFVVPSPLQTAAQTVIGQRLGAGDREGARLFLSHAQRLSFLVSALAGGVAALCAWPLAFAFTLNAAVASMAAAPLALHMATLPIKGWAMVSMAPIRAAGDTRFSMIVGLVSSALVIPFAWIGIERLHVGLYAVPLGWIAAWSARSLLTQWKLRRGTWLQASLARSIPAG